MILRKFQQEIMDNLPLYSKDNSIHIVAPPGAGKTTIGIEILKHFNQSTLILVTSLVIKNQWYSALKKEFSDEQISSALTSVRLITITTYQDFHTNYNQINTDFFKLIFLDEAHHLKRKWAEEIIEFRKKTDGMINLSLTATPPYDAEPKEWLRYIELNGAIDYEVSTAELVKENVLTPYQDYLFLISETKESESNFFDYLSNQDLIIHRLMFDDEVTDYILSLDWIQFPLLCEEKIYKNFNLYISLLVYLSDQNYNLSKKHWEILGINSTRSRRLPMQNKDYLTTLYNYLYELNPSLSIFSFLRNKKWIYHDKLALFPTYENSSTTAVIPQKKEAIAEIVLKEECFIGNQLCCIIFMDRIKKESLYGKNPVFEYGVIPIFLMLKDLKDQSTELAVICGQFTILPQTIVSTYLYEETSSDLEIDTSYRYIELSDKNRSHILSTVTELMNQNKLNILIGTVSFLGEGWNCPAINTIILGNDSSSIVQTQQLRGRGLRLSQNKSLINIWHIATVFKSISLSDQLSLNKIIKRLSYIEGLNRNDLPTVLSSGIDRFDLPCFFDEERINSFNERNFYDGKNREESRIEWDKVLLSGSHMSNEIIVKTPSFDRVNLKKNALDFYNLNQDSGDYFIQDKFFKRIRRKMKWKKYCKTLNKLIFAIYRLLIEENKLNDSNYIDIRWSDESFCCKLENASLQQTAFFYEVIKEIMGGMNEPRYIILVANCYFQVPNYFSKNKKVVEYFVTHLNIMKVKSRFFYTGNKRGRVELLKAYSAQFPKKIVEKKIWE